MNSQIDIRNARCKRILRVALIAVNVIFLHFLATGNFAKPHAVMLDINRHGAEC